MGRDQMWTKSAVALSVLCALSVILASSTQAAAAGRSEHDYWTYEISMDLDGVHASGTVKMEIEELDTIVVGGNSHEVYVISVDGSLSGSAEILGSTLTMTVHMTGFSYESVDGLATVKNDLNLVVDSSITMDGLTISATIETQSVTTYSPPLLSPFDLDATGPGDSWNETVLESTTETTWEDGVMTDQDSSEETVPYNVLVDGSLQSVTTDAGTFDCLRITVLELGGEPEFLWYSSEVRYFVKQVVFEPGYSDPVMTLELTEYGDPGPTLVILIVVIGVAVLLVAVVILVVLLSRRRQPAQPVPVPPEPPPYVPPGPEQ